MPEQSYFIRIRGKVMGPFGMDQLRSLRDRGQFRGFHEFSEDRRTWQPATGLTDLFANGSGGASNAAFTAAPPAPVTPMAQEEWYYVDAAGRKQGPLSDTQLEALSRSGTIHGQTLVWKEGLPEWMPFSTRSMNLARERVPVTAGKARTLWIVGIGTALTGLAAAAVVAVMILKPTDKALTQSTRPATGNPGTPVAALIGSATDEKGIAHAVGLVVCGARVRLPDGAPVDAPLPSLSKDPPGFSLGSCFAISADGHLITNKHVVEKAWNLKNADLLLKKLRDEDLIDLKPTVWVFFGREKCVAEVLHVSDDYDFSILKVERRCVPHFRLATADTWARGKKVAACGFPAAAQQPLSDEEVSQMYRKPKHQKVEANFNSRDFEFGLTDGSISRIIAEDSLARRWIQHNASINPGNSGGAIARRERHGHWH